MNKTYIPAFTLMEIVISLVVTAIVITLVYSSISFLSNQLRKETELRNRVNYWSADRFQLMHDFFLANEVIVDESAKNIHLITSNFQDIHYHIQEGRLYKTHRGNQSLLHTPVHTMQLVTDVANAPMILFEFELNQQSLTLYLPVKQNHADKINEWFAQKMRNGTD